MIKVMKYDDIQTIGITEFAPQSFAWIACNATDRRTNKTETIEMWIVAEEDNYKAEASRMLSGLGYDLDAIEEHHIVHAEIDAFKMYRSGVLSKK